MINFGFENIILTDDIPKDIIKMQFESIRILIDYSERLVMDGETAIDEWEKDFSEKEFEEDETITILASETQAYGAQKLFRMLFEL